MLNRSCNVVALLALASVALVAGCNTNRSREDVSAYTIDTTAADRDAQQALGAMKSGDLTLDKFFRSCHAYAVFPKVGQAGVGIAGSSGDGVVYRANDTIVGTASIESFTLGAVVGAQEFREVVFFEDAATFARFRAAPTELRGDIGAILIKNGAAQSNNYVNGVAVFVQPTDGLMANLSIGGQTFIYRGANKQ